MALSKEELELFDEPGTVAPVVAAREPGSDDDDPTPVFLPTARTAPLIMPSCKDCGTDLNPENGSQRNGVWTHIGCPAKQARPPPYVPPAANPEYISYTGRGPDAPTPVPVAAAVIPPDAPANDANAAPPAKRGRKPKAETETATPAPVAAEPVATQPPEQHQINEMVKILADAAITPAPAAQTATVIRLELGMDAELRAILRAFIK